MTERLLPEGFRGVRWSEVSDGDCVHLWGQVRCKSGYKPAAYGPHTVESRRRRELKNRRGRVFMHYAEDLLKEEREE